MSTAATLPTNGELLGPAFAALVIDQGLDEAWNILEMVREDGTDQAAIEYNMDCQGAWLFGLPGQTRTHAFFPYPAC
ncbi:MAG TPA: hypothetical protein VNL71_02205 [Chloroflexota bacterium]|nr:hypothetical protein [Chloroflexota bacterium]